MKYRFKTLAEFERDHKKELTGYIAGLNGFAEGMFPLAGKPIPDGTATEIFNSTNPHGASLDFEGIEFTYQYTPEMLTLNRMPEKWYIRGCTELKNYFMTVKTVWVGNSLKAGYFIDNNGKWDAEYIRELDSDYKEITLEQYLNFEKMDKEIIGYKLTAPEYEKAALTIAGRENLPFDKDIAFYHTSVAAERLKAVGVLDLWFEPVYEKKEFKVGDIVWIDKWYYDEDFKPQFAQIMKIEDLNPNNVRIGVYLFDGYLDKRGNWFFKKDELRHTTEEELNKLKQLPEINGYEGSVEDGFVMYGCASLPVEWFLDKGNRYITKLELSSGVVIDEESLRQIQNYLRCNTDLKH